MSENENHGSALPLGSLVGLRDERGNIMEGVVALLLSKGLTLQEIGTAFNVTRERIRQIAEAAGVPAKLQQKVRTKQRAEMRLTPTAATVAGMLRERGWSVEPSRAGAGRAGKHGYCAKQLNINGMDYCIHNSMRAGWTSKDYKQNLYCRLQPCTHGATYAVYLTPLGLYVVPRAARRILYVRADGVPNGNDRFHEAWPAGGRGYADTYAAFREMLAQEDGHYHGPTEDQC